MLCVTVFDLFNRSYTFICESFSSSTSNTLELHFPNGVTIINHDCYSHFYVYPHNKVETNVFNPSLLLDKQADGGV